MRKVYLDNLPVHKNHGVDWSKCIGKEVRFVYDNIFDTITIVNYNKNNCNLLVKYNDKEFKINTSGFTKCCFGTLLGIYTPEYKYKIGDILSTSTGEIKILDTLRLLHKGRNKPDKAYKYKCLTCGYEGESPEYNLNRGHGCSVCCKQPRKVVRGINDIATTEPTIGRMLYNENEKYNFTRYSTKRTDWICPICGNVIKDKSIKSVYQYGLSCHKCGDGVSYPNKFMFNLLKQLNIEFTTEYSPDWIAPKRYDFYFKKDEIEYIVEMDGGFHFKDNPLSGQTKECSHIIDAYKDSQAKLHDITCVRIDSCASNMEYIKNNILHSNISLIFDLTHIDWNKCDEYSQKSLVKTVAELWDMGNSRTTISNIIGISQRTIYTYLKKANSLGWCKA